MAVLNRYRKPGGFLQLLRLIETSQPIKQEQLLKAVATEDPIWAELIEQKKLTLEMVLNWDDTYLWQTIEAMHSRHCAYLLLSLGSEWVAKLHQHIPYAKASEIRKIMDEGKTPSPAEAIAAKSHLLEVVRILAEEKKLDLRQIDPRLDLDDVA